MLSSLLTRIVVAIVLGALCGLFFPEPIARVFVTFNGVFSGFLGFLIPVLILALVAPAIADLGRRGLRLHHLCRPYGLRHLDGAVPVAAGR